MAKISAVIITFNEEKYIERCLKSVARVADEIVVVDSLSTDNTSEICKSFGVRFIEKPFKGYRDQKNFALTQASYDYVLSLDADEALSPELEKSILEVKQDFKYDGYKFNRLNSFCGKWMYHTNLFPECRIRLFNRKKAHWGRFNIHEIVILDNSSSVKFLKGNLLHWLCDSYEEIIGKMNKYTTLSAEEYFKQGIRSNKARLILSPLWRFLHSFFLKLGFIDGFDGFVVSRILASTSFLKYAKLRELHVQAKQLTRAKDNRINIAGHTQSDYIEKRQTTFSIGFDAKRAFFNYSGLGNYSRNLLLALAKNFPEISYYLFTPKTKDRFKLESEESFSLIEPGKPIFKLFSSLWRTKYIINDIKKHKIKIFHGLSQELPIGIEKTGVKSVVTVHDLIFMRYPEFYNWVDLKIYFRKLTHACRVSDHIVAISSQTKNDLIDFLNISPEKISVIYQGCNPCFWNKHSNEFFQDIRMKYNLPEKYLLYVGTIEERKNLIGIVKAIHVKNINIPLIVIGRRVDLYYKKVINYITTHKLKNIYFPENISNIDLPVIYQNAECFIYPSFFEGFGIPLLEALVSGTPVITSKTGCFSEAGGPGSFYIDPYSAEMIGDTILKVVNSKELKDKMITIGSEYANKFRDEVIARAYIRLYYSLLK